MENFIKSNNEILNKWLIQNAVYVHDDFSFKDGTFPVHSRKVNFR